MIKLKTPKSERINLIYTKLSQSPTGLTIQELSKTLQVSTKTIQRDLYDTLSKYGVKKEGRKWRIDFKQVKENFNEDENMVMQILDEFAKISGNALHSRACSILYHSLHFVQNSISANIPSERLSEKDLRSFKKLEQAIHHHNEISFQYEGKSFVCKPAKLAFFDGFWYLLAFDKAQEDTFKKFHFKSLKNIAIMDKTFDLPYPFEEKLKDAQSIWFSLAESFPIRLLIDSKMKKYFLRRPFANQQFLGEHSDGSIEIEVLVSHEMEVLPILYSYIPYIKILSPNWLQDEVKNTIKTYLETLE